MMPPVIPRMPLTSPNAPDTQYPYGNNGLANGACIGDEFLLMVNTGTPGVADAIPLVSNVNDISNNRIYVKKKLPIAAVNCVGDDCHGGETPAELDTCKISPLEWGKVSKCSFTFDASQVSRRKTPCDIAVLDFINGGVIPRGLPSELFSTGATPYQLAFNWFMWQGFNDLLNSWRCGSLMGQSPSVPPTGYVCTVQPKGIDAQIVDTYSCMEANSMVDTFGGVCITDDPCGFWDKLRDMVYCQNSVADEFGLNAEWALVVRDREVLRDIANASICCKGVACGTNKNFVFSGENALSERDGVLNGLRLNVDGYELPVIFDKCAPKIVAPLPAVNKSLTTAWLVPLRVNNSDALVTEVFPFDGETVGNVGDLINRDGSGYSVVGSRRQFRVSWERKGSCLNVCIMTKFRPVVKYPFLAGKIIDIGVNTGKCKV